MFSKLVKVPRLRGTTFSSSSSSTALEEVGELASAGIIVSAMDGYSSITSFGLSSCLDTVVVTGPLTRGPGEALCSSLSLRVDSMSK